ncbi:MAG: Gfo/Idh/MocA family oxidoreductase [Microlunatus sp.]|nr:Gfo/Idh/MocA family oxidoreductase [Microlunatus sp.]
MAGAGPVGVGLIGAGVISTTYLENLNVFPDTRVLAVGDLIPEAAKARAAAHLVPAAGGVEAVLDHPGIEIVVNLTIPAAHAEVAEQAIAAGKHVWNEKPLTLDRTRGQALLVAAETAGVRIGCAPDTFLGSGLQAVNRVIADGAIGNPLTALFLMQQPGPDRWHPNPGFLFQAGGGPLFDIGPYYLTALVQIFGPVSSVAAVGSTARERRVIETGPKAGEEFDVTVPSQTAALVRFRSGQSLTLLLSFDSAVPRILLEVTGSEATLQLPDPNTFGGDVQVHRWGGEEWETLAETTARSSRGIGVLDLARAIRENRPHRATGRLAYHVLDVMSAIAESASSAAFVSVQSTVEPAEPLPIDWDPLAATV